MAREIEVSGKTVTEAETSGNFVYPEGEYIGTIIDVKPSKGGFAKSGANEGKPALDIYVRFTESGTGVGEGKKFVAFRNPDFPEFASGKAAWLFFQFYKALGVEFPKGEDQASVELPDLEEIIGQDIGLRLGIEKGTGQFEGNDRNRVVAWFDASKGVVASPVKVTGKAAAPGVADFKL